MEELQNRVDKLRERHHELEVETNKVFRELEEAEDKLTLEQLKDIDVDIPYYERKLNRLKVYIENFRQDYRGSDVNYAFEKKEQPYIGDFHQVIKDPLDYVLAEYDCLALTKYLEIVFDYHNEALKKFVKDWMEKNLSYAALYSDKKDLYNRHFSKEE